MFLNTFQFHLISIQTIQLDVNTKKYLLQLNNIVITHHNRVKCLINYMIGKQIHLLNSLCKIDFKHSKR